MATRTLKNAFLSVGGTDLSSHINTVAAPLTKDTPEDTAMGDDSRSYRPDGLRDGTLTVTWNSDDAAGAVSATLWPLFIGSAVTAIIFRADAGVVATANPEYTFDAIVNGDAPIEGAVGELQTTPTSMQISGDVARATS